MQYTHWAFLNTIKGRRRALMTMPKVVKNGVGTAKAKECTKCMYTCPCCQIRRDKYSKRKIKKNSSVL